MHKGKIAEKDVVHIQNIPKLVEDIYEQSGIVLQNSLLQVSSYIYVGIFQNLLTLNLLTLG